MEDWQEAAFNNRRIPHGRRGGGGGGGGSGGNGFDARKTYGVYELTGPSVDRILLASEDSFGSGGSSSSSGGGGGGKKGKRGGSSSAGSSRAVLEIHGLTESGDGLLGSIQIGPVMQGMVILAGSRRALERNVRETEIAEGEGDEEEGRTGDGGDEGDYGEDHDDDNDDNDDDDDDHHYGQRGDGAEIMEPTGAAAAAADNPFEKNTFRSPKFWVQWRALVRPPLSAASAVAAAEDATPQSPPTSPAGGRLGSPASPSSTFASARAATAARGETERGYFVFAGNACKTFHGTITCRSLGWKNAAINGRQITPKATDPPTGWTDVVLRK